MRQILELNNDEIRNTQGDPIMLSIAISLKRIADAFENPKTLETAIYNGIFEGLLKSKHLS